METHSNSLNFNSSVIPVGILHSLTGTMAISEVSLKEAALLAIDEINQAGGLLGKILEPIIADGESDPACFATKAEKLIQDHHVATVFGCWTSASRKAVLPIFERFNSLLWYPVQYEGLESSPNIFYTGICPNQQIEPAVHWLLENHGNQFYLIGSDYVFPRTVNKIIKAQLKHQGGKIVAEKYMRLGETDFRSIITEIKHQQPQVVFSTLNGDSNLAFYQQYAWAGIQAKEIPILAVSVSEEELRLIGDVATDHYAAWTYFQSLDFPRNQTFVRNFQQRYGHHRVTSDPIETAYSQVYLWKQAVEAAGTLAVDRVRQAAYDQTFLAPGGIIKITRNHHVLKPCRIGKILPNGQFEVVFSTATAIAPQPWLGVELMQDQGVQVIMELLAEVPQAIEETCQKDKQAEDLEAALAVLKEKNAELEAMQAQLIASQQQFQELAKREELMRRRLSSQIRDSLDLETIVQTAVQEIQQLLDIDHCLFLWYDEQPNFSENEVVYNIIAQSDTDRPVAHKRLPSSLLVQLVTDSIQSSNLRVYHELGTVHPFDPITRKYLKNLGLYGLVVMSIPTASDKWGIILCQQDHPRRPWTENELDFIQFVADQLAIAIEQAELYQKSRCSEAAAMAQAEQLQVILEELQHTQTQLIQTEKMSALGQLVAGIAHEINNPVSFIYGNLSHVSNYIRDILKLLQRYQDYYPQPAPELQAFRDQIEIDYLVADLPKMLASMKMGADRIRDIVLSLRMFSRLDEDNIKAVDIHSGIDSALMLLQHRLQSLNPPIEVIKNYGELGLVECYPRELNQVFINLLSNAIDALETHPLSSAKTITIYSTKIIGKPQQNAMDSEYVIIQISDNGPGIDETIQSRLFDPFFTTKPVGKGTGLGLSISYQIIVEKHHGELVCESVPGQGSLFQIKIPVRTVFNAADAPSSFRQWHHGQSLSVLS